MCGVYLCTPVCGRFKCFLLEHGESEALEVLGGAKAVSGTQSGEQRSRGNWGNALENAACCSLGGGWLRDRCCAQGYCSGADMVSQG